MKSKINFALFYFCLIPLASEIPIWSTVVALIISLHAALAQSGYVMTLKTRTVGLIAVLSAAFTYYKFGTLVGPEPATALLVMLAALKLEELRSLRDAIIYLFMILLLVVYYLLTTQTILATLYMLFMIFLVVLGFIVLHTPPHRLKQVVRASPKLVGRDLLLTIPIFLVLFIFFPRFSTPWASLFAKEKQLIGFTPDLKPGAMANLVRSEEPAFRVSFIGKPPSPGEMYWRGLVLDATDGWGWTATEAMNKKRQQTNEQKLINEDANYNYKIQIEPRFNKILFSLGQTPTLNWTDSAHQFNTISIKEAATFETAYPLVTRMAYTGNGRTAKVWIEDLPLARVQEMTAVPAMSRPIQDLISLWRTESNDFNALIFSDRLLEYIQDNNFEYTTETPEMANLDEFLFNYRVGFCEHYASAFATLVRAAGFPARVIIGFQGGEYNGIGNFYLIRDQHAHAWAEVWHEGQWHIYDPTSVLNISRITLGSLIESVDSMRPSKLKIAFHQLGSYYYALENAYGNFLEGYNLDVQDQLFGIRNRDQLKKYILFFCALLFITFSAVFLINMYRTRRRIDPVMQMMSDLKAALSKKGIAYQPADGPLALYSKVIAKWPIREQEVEQHFNAWIQVRYRSANHEAVREQNRAMLKFIQSL